MEPIINEDIISTLPRGEHMRRFRILLYSTIMVTLISLSLSCSKNQPVPEVSESPAPQQTAQENNPPQPTSSPPIVLPTAYQLPTYVVGNDFDEDLAITDEAVVRVGATIRSTRGPQPLWDIMRRLVALKEMNVSWASDVDQNVLVDVDINAADDFFNAIDNLLRQVDYFHEVQGNTIVIKYKETRQFKIAMPFIASQYTTESGGNLLGSPELSTNVKGTIQLDSTGNTFDIWENIQANMDKIIALWSTTTVTPTAGTDTAEGGEENQSTMENLATRRVSSSDVAYFIDKPVGIITVTAPRPLLQELDKYFTNLTNSLYKQVSIEAKILEVQLKDNSKIGLDWSQVLKDFNVTGTVVFGDLSRGGQVYPKIQTVNDSFNDGTVKGNLLDPTAFISQILLDPTDFSVLLNALEEQGNTRILSNPKISVLNGQPALITVGRNVTYVDSVETDIDTSATFPTTTITVETARILSGVGLSLTANVMENNEIVMNLVPVTSELEEPIEYRFFGGEAAQVGLPVVNIRQISTTVRVRDGEMLVIGGLISEVEQTTSDFVPLVGKIPIVRYLFGVEEKIKEKRELIILLRPVII
ncbi:MAG TPA: pilus (MSHA type) biogenesis protein MshL [Desulfofustis sp.]|jgi:MSHA type pilus biogenesis protein MshL|nr:pilus (MSHA type) biogenesis protein MshL [Desulfofustis sp. PB-SRB1]HBH27850.1 pilus (MSHA type) biogenesis protein MshL [Desulfofustis sp.]HBH30332.1 pilus (MSHA type) biogenesis protein MshL [Desulfofustis sp.]